MSSEKRAIRAAGSLFLVLGATLMMMGYLSARDGRVGFPRLTALGTERAMSATTSTPEPIVPTRTATSASASSNTATSRPTNAFTVPVLTPLREATATKALAPALPTATATVWPTLTPLPASMGDAPVQISTMPPAETVEPTEFTEAAAAAEPVSEEVSGFAVPVEERYRLGVSLPGGAGTLYDLEPLKVGWVMDWWVRAAPVLPEGVTYAQTVRMESGMLHPDAATLTAVAVARPGSFWLISNEPDVRWQDSVDATTYARLYHKAYHAIKMGDPAAVVAAGGIAQPSELRLRYLDLALQEYTDTYGVPLPADAWHIHNYMLREERDSWGVDIPPGFSDNMGMLYGVEDSSNLEAFKAQIYAFRRWMLNRGYGGLPLLVTEYGIPMPSDYGFTPEVAEDFLRGSWQFFLTATDPVLGSSADGGRLVQRWCWFSLGYADYPTGDLVDTQTGEWTHLARAWMAMVAE